MNSGGAEGEEKLHSRRKDAFGLTTEAATNTTQQREASKRSVLEYT